MDEKLRVQEVFDNWYYQGFSDTNKREPISIGSITKNMNNYLKWKLILTLLYNANRRNLSEYKILDAGCGNGNVIRRLVEEGASPSNCYGVDISQDAIDFARHYSPTDVTYQVGLIDELPFADNSFDLVFNFGVLIHLLDNDYIRKIAHELHRVMKPDGLLFVIVSCENAIWHESIAHTTRNFSFREQELQNLFSEFECLGAFHSYNDGYPSEYSPSEIITMIEKDQVDTTFKLAVFQPKK